MLGKLRRRFILDNMILTLIVVVGSCALLVAASFTFFRNNSNEAMQEVLNQVTEATVTVSEEDGTLTATLPGEELELREGTAIMLLSPDGDLLDFRADNEELRQDIEENMNTIRKFVAAAEDPEGVVATQILRYNKAELNGVGQKVALIDRGPELEAIYFQLRLVVGIAFIIFVLMLAICDFLARRSILPVDEAIRNQQQFIADASHELKTPLTVILANLDIVDSNKEQTVEEAGKWLENTRSEAQRMSKLVNEMLFLARSDAAMDMHYNFRLISFADVVDEVVLATEALAFENNITLEDDIAEPSAVVGDFDRLKQVVMILVENALKYVDDNGTVTVKLTSTPRRQEVLTVTNTGTPIPPEKATHIFDRFYRVDDSRVREKGGYGLGLSIAQNIVKKHNGEISLVYSNETGTQFQVKLPHAQNMRAPELSTTESN